MHAPATSHKKEMAQNIPAKKIADVHPLASSVKKSPKAELLAAYELMLLIRRFEEKAASLYQQGHIGGFCHLYIGQEAVIAGCRAATTPEDDYITSYRCHAHALACGISPEQVMAELTGRVGGISKGKGGSMHMFDPEKRFWGGHGIVAAQVPLGAGLAFAAKYKGETRASLTFIGDGAMNAGQVFETFNMAALWKLPALFIIENNQYGMGTSVPRAAAGELWKRGEPFGIPGKKIDGMDFFAVRDAITEAMKLVRAGQPVLLEMDTYRYRGHSMSDPAKYRTREQVECVREQRDPITNLGKVLQAEHSISAAELEAIDERIKTRMAAVEKFALESPLPDESELFTDIMPE